MVSFLRMSANKGCDWVTRQWSGQIDCFICSVHSLCTQSQLNCSRGEAATSKVKLGVPAACKWAPGPCSAQVNYQACDWLELIGILCLSHNSAWLYTKCMLHSCVHSLILSHIQQNNYVPLGIMLLTIAYVIDFESHIPGCVWCVRLPHMLVLRGQRSNSSAGCCLSLVKHCWTFICERNWRVSGTVHVNAWQAIIARKRHVVAFTLHPPSFYAF